MTMPGHADPGGVDRLVGRDEELTTAAEFLARAQRDVAGLLITGEPGIGKTTLWRSIIARHATGRVLVHRAVERDASLAFGGLADLFDGIPGGEPHAMAALAPPRRRAVEAALLLGEPDPEWADPRALGLGVADLLRELARSGPVLVAVDDLQWLDDASGRALRFALRRFRQEPIALLATHRAAGAVPVARDLAEALGDGWFTPIALGPLPPAALHGLLRARLGLDLARPQLLRLHDLTAGNPYFAVELGAELRRTGARLDPGHPRSLPSSLEQLLGARLDRLSRPCLDLVELAAAGTRPDLSSLPWAADPAGADAALREAIQAGVLRVDGDRLAFAHPLLASVCYARIAPPIRRRLHRRLADAARDPEEAAHHLARSTDGPDGAVAARIGEGAERAAARGAMAVAAELVNRAADLTPGDDPAGARARRRRSAEFWRRSGDLERSATTLARLLDESPAGPERADALFALARTRRADLRTAIEQCEAALREAAGDDRREADILGYLGWLHQAEGEIELAVRRSRAAVERSERAADPVLLARSIARASMEELWAMDHTPGLLARGVELESTIEASLAHHDRPSLTLARHLALTGDHGAARTIYESAARDALDRGEDVSLGRIHFHLALVEWYDGQPMRALAHAADALELADQLHDDQYRGTALHVSSFIDAHLGLLDRAAAAADEGRRIAAAVGDALFEVAHRNVLGFVALTRGDVRAAAELLAPLPDAPISRGWLEPAFNPVWPNAIEALSLAGDDEAARRHLAELERRAARSISEWSRAVAARCRGQVEAVAGRLDAADAAFELAAHTHDRVRAPFDRARTLLDWGALHRRRKRRRAARDLLEEAGREFAAIGARPWLERTTVELSRLGGRPRSDRLLTPTQERVARLAADGLSNKEIASLVGCSVATVEAHLTHVYAKLDVRSRVELDRRLSVPSSGASGEVPMRINP